MEDEETPRVIRARVTKQLERFASFVSPTAATIYFILSEIFGLPAAIIVLGVLAITSSIIGTFLLIQKGRHQDDYDGSIVISENENGGKLFSIEVNGEPLDMEFKDEVLFKIKRLSDPQ